MLSVASVAVHRNIRSNAPANSSSTANIIVDTSLSWNAELAQSPKRRLGHQGPCGARKKLIQSTTDDISLNLNLNNAEVTLTPIKKAVSGVEFVGGNNDRRTYRADVGEQVFVDDRSDRDGVYPIVEIYDETKSTESNGGVKSGGTESRNRSLVPFVNSNEISIRPIARKVQRKVQNVEGSILKSELSITKSDRGDAPVTVKMQSRSQFVASKIALAKNLSLRTTKFTEFDSIDTIESPNDVENLQILSETLRQKLPAQRPMSAKKFQNPTKKASANGMSTKMERAIAALKNSSDNFIRVSSSNVNNSPLLKPGYDISCSSRKVAAVPIPVVPNLQEICTARNNFDTPDTPWHMSNIDGSTPTLLESPDDAIDLQEPYQMTGFPNPPGENRCWLNATLQALFAMPLLDTFHRYNLQDCSNLTKYLIAAKVHWMKGVGGRDKAYQTVKLLKEELGVLNEAYPSERQQDVSEFLMILLNHVKSDLGRLISAEDEVVETENVPKNQQDSLKVAKMPQTPNKRQPLADISTPKNNGLIRSLSLGDPGQSPKFRKQILTHSVQDLLSPKLRKSSNPSDPSYKVHTPPLAPTDDDDALSFENPVDENFQLYLMEHYTCKGCDKHRQKKVDNLMLFVDIPSDDSLAPINLQKAMENIFAPEERNLTCGNCEHDVHTMRTTFRRQPNILTLQVNRYGLSSGGIFAKINTEVEIPKKLDLGENFLHDASTGTLTYEPICVIAHAGSTMDCGHYTSYVRHGEQWYHYNDMNVAPMTAEEALSAAQMTAYLVFLAKSTSAEQDSNRRRV